MRASQILALAGAVLGGGAGLFRLGQAVAAAPALETVIPGVLALAFAIVAGWGGFFPGVTPRKGLRAVLGGAIGGLVAVDLFFIPAAVAFLGAAYLIWREPK